MKTLGISPISGTVYYGSVGIDKHGIQYWKTKEEVPVHVFVQVMMSFIKHRCDDKGVMTITADGKPMHIVTLTDIDVTMGGADKAKELVGKRLKLRNSGDVGEINKSELSYKMDKTYRAWRISPYNDKCLDLIDDADDFLEIMRIHYSRLEIIEEEKCD